MKTDHMTDDQIAAELRNKCADLRGLILEAQKRRISVLIGTEANYGIVHTSLPVMSIRKEY